VYKEILENTINTRRKFEEDSMNLGIKDVSLSNQRRFKDVQRVSLIRIYSDIEQTLFSFLHEYLPEALRMMSKESVYHTKKKKTILIRTYTFSLFFTI